MPGEVLATRGHPARLHRFDQSHPTTSDHIGIATEGSTADHRIGGVRIDIDHWSQIEVNPDRSQVRRQPGADFRGGSRSLVTDLSHGRWRVEAISEPNRLPTFLIDADEDRIFGSASKGLDFRDRPCHLLTITGISCEENDGPDPLLDEFCNLLRR